MLRFLYARIREQRLHLHKLWRPVHHFCDCAREVSELDAFHLFEVPRHARLGEPGRNAVEGSPEGETPRRHRDA